MIDTQARPAPYVRLLVLVALLGLVSASITFGFIALVDQAAQHVWQQFALALRIDPRLFTLLVCTIGGLLVGLLVTLLGDHSGTLAEVTLEFGKTGRFDYRHAPGIVITAFVSLNSGARIALRPRSCAGLRTKICKRSSPAPDAAICVRAAAGRKSRTAKGATRHDGRPAATRLATPSGRPPDRPVGLVDRVGQNQTLPALPQAGYAGANQGLSLEAQPESRFRRAE